MLLVNGCASTASVVWAVFLAFLIVPSVSVKHHDFKRCEQSGFCKRNRDLADSITSNSAHTSPYELDASSLRIKDGRLRGDILKSISDGVQVKLPIYATFLESGNVRVAIDEERRQRGDIELRHGSAVRKERYNEAGTWALTGAGLQPQKNTKFIQYNGRIEVKWGSSKKLTAVIRYKPFAIEFYNGQEQQVVLNGKGFLNIEHWRPKVDKPIPPEGEIDETVAKQEEDESTWWEETFGGNTDSKPRGPESVALDITFPGYSHVYGIPEHAGPLSLKETKGGDGNYDQPYRMFNSDVFEYELDNPMTLYGSIPFMQAHKKDSTVGVFWLNAAETWVDITKQKQSLNPFSLGSSGLVDTTTHWISESGVLDVFILLTPGPRELAQSYAELTGTSAMPQMFSIAYHQCRWNYVSDEDVKDVDRKFDKFNIPYDVIWLDLEYTDDRKYFTWAPDSFKDPTSMGKHLEASERNLVVLIDPHIKNKEGYHVVDELKSKDLATKDKNGNIFEGWCWPGSSHWIDAFNPAARQWWKTLFAYDRFKGTLSNTWIWNDMNEPSVFNGPEVSMPHDNIHHGGWEHRDVHNLNGMTFHNATWHALVQRSKSEAPRRPFVLTRAFFSGSQRSAAMWTGDNQADWGHLAASIPMVLNQGVGGFPFAGADIGGFFGNPEKELLTRWYQTGIFYPFMRAHAHLDARRREPYLLGSPYTEIITQAVRLRYSLLPAWYTAFHEAHTAGLPIVRAQYFVHPGDEKGFSIDDQFYLGSTGILAKPVVTDGAQTVDIYISDNENYFDYFDFTMYSGSAQRIHTISAPLEKIPLLMQGGHIFPRKDRPRRSSGLMKWDPYTLVVVMGKDGAAQGELYIDDGESFDYQQGAYIHRKFVMKDGELKSEGVAANTGPKASAFLKSMISVTVGNIIVVDAPKSWAGLSEVEVEITSGKKPTIYKVDVAYHAEEGGKSAWASVRNPATPVGSDWMIRFPGAHIKSEL